MATNPILTELSGLSPGAKQALMQAHTATSSTPAAPPMQPPKIDTGTRQATAGLQAPGAPPPPAIGASMTPTSPMPFLNAPASPSVRQMTPLEEGTHNDENERERLLSTGSGISQIKNPVLKGLAGVGNAIGHIAAPGLMAQIPGTEEHHEQLLGRVNKNLTGDLTFGKDEAQNANLASQPELRQAKQDLAEEKQNETQTNHQNTLHSTLAQHGFAMDEDGSIRPLKYEEMNPTQQSVVDLKGAQEELADANAAYKKAQKDNLPQAMQMAQQRIATAQRNASTAAGRLGLSKAEYNANYLGTDATGENPLPGAPATAEGKPEGLKTANLTKPTGTTQSKGQQGGIIIEAGNQLKQAIDQHKDKIGNLGSYWNQYVNGTPISDPTVSKLMAQIGSYAALQPALHGFRGQQALAEFTKIIGGVPKNPEALKAAIDGIAGTAGIVQKAGHVRTVDEGEHPTNNVPTRPAGVPENYQWNPQGNGGKGSWRAPQ